MNVYQTDANGYFVGVTQASESPLEPGVFLIPGGCKAVAPPAVSANQAARFADGAWTVVPDFNGTTYWLADGTQHTMSERGIDLPADALLAEPPAPPPPIPTVVTMRQARLAMLDAGILTSVRDALAAMTGITGEAARIEWEYAAELKRDHPLVASLSAALGLTSAQLDGLFTVAAGL